MKTSFTISFGRVCHWILLREMDSVLTSHLQLVFKTGLFPSGLTSKILYSLILAQEINGMKHIVEI